MKWMHAPIHVSDLEAVLRRVALIRKMSDAPKEVRVEEVKKVDIESLGALERVRAAQDTWEPHQIYVFEKLLIERTNPS